MRKLLTKKSIGTKLRARRIAPLLSMIEVVYKEYGCVNIIDIGGTERHWDIIPSLYFDKNNVNITIVNLPGTEMPRDRGRFKFIAADGCDLREFDGESFHIAHSNSVVEHVGDWRRMVSFANELSRVAPKYHVQTQN